MKILKIAGLVLLAAIVVFFIVGIIANMQPKGPMTTQTSTLRGVTIAVEIYEDRGPEVKLTGAGFDQVTLPQVQETAATGNRNAQQLLGTFHTLESSVSTNGVEFAPLDLKQSANWYHKAAVQGDPISQIYLGEALEYGQGIEKNAVDARLWYERAAAQNHVLGHYKIGFFYENGLGGLTQDSARGLHHTNTAANMGHAGAQVNLGVNYYHGNGVQKDMATAARWFTAGANAGDRHGQYLLGHMYDNGYGVAKDSNLALQWYELSAEQGHEDARKRLEEIKAAS